MKLIQPIFVHEGDTQDTKLGKDNKLYSLYDAPDRIYQDQEQGVQEFLLFLVPLTKDNDPTWSWQGEAVEKIKALTGHHAKITVDICLCSTTEDGHCHVHARVRLKSWNPASEHMGNVLKHFVDHGLIAQIVLYGLI